MKLLLFLTVFFVSFTAVSQAVVANEKMNIAYVGVQNPLQVAVSGYPCSSVVLTTDNGKMEKVDCGRFIYVPEKPGAFPIKICVKTGSKLKVIATWMYRIKRLPDPVAFIGSQHGGTINKIVLIKMGGVVARLLDSDFEAPFQVLSYTISAIRNNSSVFSINNTGAQFSSNVVAKLESLQTNDHLLISDIKCVGPDGNARIIAPMEFVVTE